MDFSKTFPSKTVTRPGLIQYKLVENRKAVSLIEIMIAVAIVGLAIVPSLNLLSVFKTYTLSIEDIQLGTQLAEEMLEHYKSLAYEDLFFDNYDIPASVQVKDQEIIPGLIYTNPILERFKREVTITKNYDGDVDKIMIKVRVWWYEGMFDMNDLRYIEIGSLKTKSYVI